MRTVFPMTNSIQFTVDHRHDLPRIVHTRSAIRQLDSARNLVLSAAAAMYAMISAGSQAALAFTAILSIGALFFPHLQPLDCPVRICAGRNFSPGSAEFD